VLGFIMVTVMIFSAVSVLGKAPEYSAKVAYNGAGTNKTEFNLRSLNIGMDRRIAQDKTIGFALGLGKQDRTL
jgi:hypothetical protein